MSKVVADDEAVKEFHEEHPYPAETGVNHLYHFSRINPSHPEYLDALFLRAKLYHSLPEEFNDPFDCKPLFKWPDSAKEAAKLRRHFEKISREQGASRKEAIQLASKVMASPRAMEERFQSILHENLGSTRICCFTTDKENLLFWAHYAAGHQGFCVEFSPEHFPLSTAFKVKYSETYPLGEIPSPRDQRALRPLLVKSKHWEYENEFRTLLITNAKTAPKNDGSSVILNGDEISAVYLGARMEERQRQIVIQKISDGPFSPKIYRCKVSPSAFKLIFEEVDK